MKPAEKCCVQVWSNTSFGYENDYTANPFPVMTKGISLFSNSTL